jgi:hypothetical protein
MSEDGSKAGGCLKIAALFALLGGVLLVVGGVGVGAFLYFRSRATLAEVDEATTGPFTLAVENRSGRDAEARCLAGVDEVPYRAVKNGEQADLTLPKLPVLCSFFDSDNAMLAEFTGTDRPQGDRWTLTIEPPPAAPAELASAELTAPEDAAAATVDPTPKPFAPEAAPPGTTTDPASAPTASEAPTAAAPTTTAPTTTAPTTTAPTSATTTSSSTASTSSAASPTSSRTSGSGSTAKPASSTSKPGASTSGTSTSTASSTGTSTSKPASSGGATAAMNFSLPSGGKWQEVEVFIDGRTQGKRPLRATVTVGRHSVRFVGEDIDLTCAVDVPDYGRSVALEGRKPKCPSITVE